MSGLSVSWVPKSRSVDSDTVNVLSLDVIDVAKSGFLGFGQSR